MHTLVTLGRVDTLVPWQHLCVNVGARPEITSDENRGNIYHHALFVRERKKKKSSAKGLNVMQVLLVVP